MSLTDEVWGIIKEEIEYAEKMWDSRSRSERPLKDAEKSVEFWLLHMRRYLHQAEEGCYDTDKGPALAAIRKIAALCVRCMCYHETPRRE